MAIEYIPPNPNNIQAAIAEIERISSSNRHLRKEVLKLQAREKELKGLILRMIDRWWPFVHGSLPSNTARSLYKEAVGILTLYRRD